MKMLTGIRPGNTVCAKIYSIEMKRQKILPCCHLSLFLLEETNIHTISVFIYHGTRNVSVRSVHHLAVDSVHIVRDVRVSYLLPKLITS
jgi:hypothetical protein